MPRKAWYAVCGSAMLKGKPLARSLLGAPLVLFRDGMGKAAALLDRCAHRNVPLSLGRAAEGRLECRYHGWQYDAAGACLKVPGLCGTPPARPGLVPSHPVLEQDGYVWIWADPGSPPDSLPFRLPALGEGYTTVRRTVEAEASLHAVLENALDVPHTAFLHRGLFRGAGKKTPLTVRVSRTAQGLEAEYSGEERPKGLAGWILSPSGGQVSHWDRFILPSIAQVEYRLGSEIHFLVTSLCAPLDDSRTALHAVMSFKTRLPGWLVAPALGPVALAIFRQDARILKAQARALRRFGGEDYVSTEADVLGLRIAQLLRRPEPVEEWRRELRLEV